MNYTRTHADDTVTALYKKSNIIHTQQLTPDTICECLGYGLAYLPVDSLRINQNIYLDSRLTKEERWQQFGHELCHVLWHQDNQLHLSQSFIDLQERQADNFALYACIPTDMLLNIRLPSTDKQAANALCETFNVTPEFAMKRLELHISKMYQATY